jgi:hypothetical protein
MKGALTLAAPADPDWDVRCLAVSAALEDGIEALASLAAAHYGQLVSRGVLARRRHAQAEAWLRAEIEADFGRRGVALLGAVLRLGENESPFAAAARLRARLAITFN